MAQIIGNKIGRGCEARSNPNSMTRIWLHVITFFSLSLFSFGQNIPWWELYAGYQFTSYREPQMQTLLNLSSTSSGLAAGIISDHVSLNGWNLSAQENANSWFGGIVDFSGGYGVKKANLHQSDGKPTAADFSPGFFTMGGGPQLAYRGSERIQPFARFIFAAAYSNLNQNQFISDHSSLGGGMDTALALIGGGGIDYRVNRYAYARIAGDYIHTSLFGRNENNFRISAGINFRIERH